MIPIGSASHDETPVGFQVDERGQLRGLVDGHEGPAGSRALDHKRVLLREGRVADEVEVDRVAGRQVDLQREASLSRDRVKVVIAR